ncbi:MAG: hypothetical protein R2713_03285 [Ilumatobacteraceae bacterium]
MTTTEHGLRTIDGIELTPKQVGLEVADPVRLRRGGRACTASRSSPGRWCVFGRVGFGEGVAGHITVRDPVPELFW